MGVIARAAAVAVVCSGCFGEELTPFPSGLEPLEPSQAPPLGPGCPRDLVLAEGERPEHLYVHARGCVPAPLAETWEAMREPDASVDRRAAARWDVSLDTEPQYPFSYTLHVEVRRFLTVRFDMAWRHGPVGGTVEAPERAAARWQKVAGTTAIAVLEGSALAFPRDGGDTEIELVYRLDGALRNPADIRGFVEDYHASVVALVEGRPLPTWRD